MTSREGAPMRLTEPNSPAYLAGCARLVASALFIMLVPGTLFAQVGPDERNRQVQRARELIENQRFEEAREIYQALAARDPRDLDARIWVARLTAWESRYAEALELYQAVLADDPVNVEVRLGMADVLGWQGQYDDALASLVQMDAQYPENPAVLARIARLHRWQNHRQEAMDYYRQTVAADPSNQEAKDALEILTAQLPFQFESGYLFEEFDFVKNTHGQFVQLTYHDFDRLTVLGRFQFQNKFDQNNSQATVGLTYRAGERTWLRGEFSGAPPNDTIIANTDYTLELTQAWPNGASLGGSYRFLDFDAAEVQVLTVMGAWQPRDDFRLFLRYTPAHTQFNVTGQSVWNQGGSIGLRWDAHKRVSPFLLFGVGAESFEGLSTDRLGRFAAQVYGGGAEVRFANAQGIRVGYSFQNRTQSHRQQGFTLSYFFSFE